MRQILALAALVSVGCGSSPTAPSPPPIQQRITLTGHLTATNSGQAIGGATIQAGSLSAITDGNGAFTLSLLPASALRLSITGPLVAREVSINALSAREVTVAGFTEGADFDLAYYRQIVRGSLDNQTLQPIRRWTQAPRIYIRTVDENGALIDGATLDVTENAIRTTALQWTGGAFGIATLERGPDTHLGQDGWITVRWIPNDSSKCGAADVAKSGGDIELYYRNPTCSCGASQIRPRTVRHELGHAFGLWHTGDPADLMSGLSNGACDQNPSARELQYARYLYARPVGNTDPDSDPTSAVLLRPITIQ